MGDLPKNVAIVYDRANKWGGAEQILLALHNLFPQAPLYTLVHNPSTAKWTSHFPSVHTSFLQNLKIANTHHEWFPWLAPFAFELFDFSKYDAVISVSSADAKGIITSPNTFHIDLCLTPTRYLWSHFSDYLPFWARQVFSILSRYLRVWDLVAASRPDAMYAISNTVASRVQRYYRRQASVIYPPVAQFPISKITSGDKPYFLWIGRLVTYKHPEQIVRLFNNLHLPLMVVGTGHLEKHLKKIAGPTVKILGLVSESEKVKLFAACKALVSYHEEDFGLSYVEAQSFGKPIIALNKGGVSEIVTHKVTGLLANNIQEFANYVKSFDQYTFDKQQIKISAQRFSVERFSQEFAKVFTLSWNQYKNTYSS